MDVVARSARPGQSTFDAGSPLSFELHACGGPQLVELQPIEQASRAQPHFDVVIVERRFQRSPAARRQAWPSCSSAAGVARSRRPPVRESAGRRELRSLRPARPAIAAADHHLAARKARQCRQSGRPAEISNPWTNSRGKRIVTTCRQTASCLGSGRAGHGQRPHAACILARRVATTNRKTCEP